MDRYWRCSWNRCSGAAVALSVALGLQGCGGSAPDELVRQYVAAANAHDLAALEAMLSNDVVWHLGGDTLAGKAQVLEPLDFDIGAQTHLELGEIVVRGDTAEFEMAEHNRVLMTLGIHELRHHARFVFRDGLIALKQPSRPPDEIGAMADSVSAFASWLYAERPQVYRRIWTESGKFNYSEETGALMLELAGEWRARDGQ